MEIDDLKKKWSALSGQLERKEVITDEELLQVVKQKQDHVNSIMNAMKRNNRTIWLATAVLYALIIGIRLFDGSYFNETFFRAMIIFALPALAWSLYTMRYLGKTNIYEMPLAAVIERVNRYKYWMSMERIAGSVILFAFALLFIVTTELWKNNAKDQFVIVGIWVVGFVVYFWAINKYTFRRLRRIRRNLEELREVGVES